MADAVVQDIAATVYREDDEVGEHEIQTYVLEVLRPLLARFLQHEGVLAHVGSDQHIYWQRFAPQKCLAPDIYVLPGVAQDIAIGTWKVWEHDGVVPELVIEVVGSDPGKDYQLSPARCDELGVRELIVLDPFEGAERTRFQVFRRRQGEGLVRVVATDSDRVDCRVLGAWLRAVGEDAALRLRVATGDDGEVLFPTEAEAEREAKEAEREAKEAALAAGQAEREATQAERKAKEAALAEIVELRRRLREGGDS